MSKNRYKTYTCRSGCGGIEGAKRPLRNGAERNDHSYQNENLIKRERKKIYNCEKPKKTTNNEKLLLR